MVLVRFVKMRLTCMVLLRFGCSIYKNLSSDKNLATTQDKYTCSKAKYNPENPPNNRNKTKETHKMTIV